MEQFPMKGKIWKEPFSRNKMMKKKNKTKEQEDIVVAVVGDVYVWKVEKMV